MGLDLIFQGPKINENEATLGLAVFIGLDE